MPVACYFWIIAGSRAAEMVWRRTYPDTLGDKPTVMNDLGHKPSESLTVVEVLILVRFCADQIKELSQSLFAR
jgi:hypothetical protein